MDTATAAAITALSPQQRAQLDFYTWLRNTFPQMWTALENAAARGQLGGLGDIFDLSLPDVSFDPSSVAVPDLSIGSSGGFLDTISNLDFGSIASNIAKLGTTVLSYKAQQDVLSTNLQRAKVGLPPISASAAGISPTVNVGADPALVAALQKQASTAGNYLLIGGLALAAIFLVPKMLKGR